MTADVEPLTHEHKLFCFGLGYSAGWLARLLAASGVRVAGTRREPAARDATPVTPFDGSRRTPEAATLLGGASHVLVSIPPDANGDPVLRWFADNLAGLPSLAWIGYLSTVGVYGDTAGAWVDETAPLKPQSERARRRAAAEAQWRAFAARTGKRVEIFRLPGIYGAGRCAIDALRAGTARRIVKPAQVFNRIHVADIAETLACAMAAATARRSPSFDTFNLVDDEPAPPQDVVAYAAELIGMAPPPEVPLEAAALSPMAASFYAENRRVSNARLRAAFGLALLYPSYREGLRAIAAELVAGEQEIQQNVDDA